MQQRAAKQRTAENATSGRSTFLSWSAVRATATTPTSDGAHGQRAAESPGESTLYLKTHNFHNHVTGPMFQALHLLFETQHNELALAVDSVAERIRALGFPAPGSDKQFLQLSSITDDDGTPTALGMIRLLVEGHETVARTARAVLKIADSVSDQPTCDLLTQRMQVHEKTAWMLRRLLE
jgi:starvation-inducible DNA-binding protein